MVTMPTSTQDAVDVSALQARLERLESRVEELQEQLPEDRVTFVVFSGDLDRVLAAFIIATGALAMGQQVSMFFTFWGLSALKKQRILNGKSLTEKMMSLMTPGTTSQMGVSNLNFFGVGAKMLRYMMNEKNVETFEGLVDVAEEMGATMYSCAMSQDVMGIKIEELRDNAEIAGVAGFLADALCSKATLFI